MLLSRDDGEMGGDEVEGGEQGSRQGVVWYMEMVKLLAQEDNELPVEGTALG